MPSAKVTCACGSSMAHDSEMCRVCRLEANRPRCRCGEPISDAANVCCRRCDDRNLRIVLLLAALIRPVDELLADLFVRLCDAEAR